MSEFCGFFHSLDVLDLIPRTMKVGLHTEPPDWTFLPLSSIGFVRSLSGFSFVDRLHKFFVKAVEVSAWVFRGTSVTGR